VLLAKEYEEDHLPGAINLPLRKLETDARREFVGRERVSGGDVNASPCDFTRHSDQQR